MDIYITNGIVLPLFVTWFIPNAIRDSRTGEYRGFKNAIVLTQLALLLGFEGVLILNEFGMSYLSLLRIAFSIILTFSLALIFVKLTHKKLFGNEFSMKVRQENRIE